MCYAALVAQAADAEAAKYRKIAVARGQIDSRANSAFGGIQTVVFDLVTP
jgi:hypothetical protein